MKTPESSVDYRSTLNLPRTDFAMKADLPQREPIRLKEWQDVNLYEGIRKIRAGAPKYVLHDGPPYANGDLHLGHVLNKVLKDVLVKYHTMRGQDAPYVPGWDCHGTPIEIQMLKSMGIAQQGRPKNLPAFRLECRAYATKYIDIQREQFKRLGVFGDWEQPYLTMAPEYVNTVLATFMTLAKKGLVYRGFKPVLWCPTCVTALAEAEVEYEDKSSPSVYVKFPISTPSLTLPPRGGGVGGGAWPFKKFGSVTGEVSVLIWTTTPWTLPTNVAIAVHPQADYVLVQAGGEGLVVAKDRVEALKAEQPEVSFEILETVKGAQLEGVLCEHPFLKKTSQVVLASYVTMTDGTGCVHTAPAHGKEDYDTSTRYPDLGVPVWVNEKGLFTEDAGDLAGQFIEKANPVIIEKMRTAGRLWKEGQVVHSYPHCWRCHRPVIYRAARQWFLRVEGLREGLLRHIEHDIQWIPEQGRNRMRGMLETRPDWCLSRQRSWGTPIPIMKCRVCDESLTDPKVLDFTLGEIVKRGVDAWFQDVPESFVPQGTCCSKGHGTSDLEKELDILDVWFDSACSYLAVLEKRPELGLPADVYLEGSDQHRGWFQVSLITAEAMKGRPPMKTILTHGFIVDEQGKKMSKSKGNFVTAMKACDTYGADILRLWATSEDYQGDIRLGETLMEQVKEAYRKIRNTCRFALSNLYDVDPAWQPSSIQELSELDRLALYQLNRFLTASGEAFDQLAFYRYGQALKDYCIVDLSSVYFDVLKDRLYTARTDGLERRRAQWVLLRIVEALAKTMAPIMPFTAEEIWQNIPRSGFSPSPLTGEGRGEGGSVHFQPWPVPDARFQFDEAHQKVWGSLFGLRDEALKMLEAERQAKKIGKSLESKLKVKAGSAFHAELEKRVDWLADFFVVSSVELVSDASLAPAAFQVEALPADGQKCSRCWKQKKSVGQSSDHPTLCDICVDVIKYFERSRKSEVKKSE